MDEMVCVPRDGGDPSRNQALKSNSKSTALLKLLGASFFRGMKILFGIQDFTSIK